MIIDNIKNMKDFYSKLDGALSYLVNKYRDYAQKENKKEILDKLANDLDRISNLLDNYGYTYRPSNGLDISNKSFDVVLVRYLNGFQDYLDKGIGEVETIATDIRTLLGFVDKHRAIKENFE